MTHKPSSSAGASEPPPRILGAFAAVWGAGGLLALLLYSIARLSGIVVAGLAYPWEWHHLAVAVANAAFMAYSEGYRGFQLGFSPRSAARAKWLAHHASPLTAALAPLFVMGYFGATRRRMIGIYALTAFIVVAIVLIHSLPQPWRAALDIGVVLGLAWGAATFVSALRRTFREPGYPASPEVPEAEAGNR